ncbi:M3 family metallopeptidase [Teredinibacter turnerae]|uniref:M3 family metallopeptidase n=1 Tax=Teredinibacter turnerae TaxID=2426 RepID=UPI00037FF8C7|nr:M3 family metallopeptidase [Teredinibacter turnerae]
MRFSLLAAMISTIVLTTGCESEQPQPDESKTAMQQSAENIFFHESPLSYHAPEFDKLKVSDYEPAFAEGLKEHSPEILQIANNPEKPTFDNTIVAMEKSGALLSRVYTLFGSLSGLVSNDEYRRIESDFSPKLAEHSDSIFLNPQLFKRVVAVYESRDSLNAEDQRLAEYYYKRFVREGAKLSPAAKARVMEINTEISTLQTDFSQNILKSLEKDVVLVKDKADLAGLSESQIESLAAAAKKSGNEGYQITLVNTTRHPLLGSLENRELRKKLWETSAYRAMDTNGPIVLKLTKLRAEKAKLLGFDTWAAYVVDNQMAKTPAAVFGILDGLAPKAVARAKEEAADIQAEIKKAGGDFTLQPWDWLFYAEKVRQAKYDLDESLLKPYFEFNTVLNDGLFFAMNKLYGISLKPRKDLPVWDENVLAYEVYNEDGSTIGLFYIDPYAREGKRGGAWMSNWVEQNGLLDDKPVIYNALNIPKPAEGQPTLMTFDEVETLFHEFGHAIHGLFSDVKYPSLAGTSTARDFVEFPSQANEDWDIDPAVLKNYAKHYETGEPIPQELLDKMLKAHKFNSGFNTVEYLAAALLDMEWHTISADSDITDVAAFEKEALAKHKIDFAPVPPRYKSAYFSHIFAGGYSAGYYAYLWTEVLAADAFAYTQTLGGLTRENGDKYRNAVLSRGNSRDLMESYVDFRGQEPSIDALLERRGLVK